MNSKTLFLSFIVLLCFSCTPKINSSMQAIEITGTAFNAKIGAVVLAEGNTPYYIEGLSGWKKNQLGTKVKVKGIPEERSFPRTETR